MRGHGHTVHIHERSIKTDIPNETKKTHTHVERSELAATANGDCGRAYTNRHKMSRTSDPNVRPAKARPCNPTSSHQKINALTHPLDMSPKAPPSNPCVAVRIDVPSAGYGLP